MTVEPVERVAAIAYSHLDLPVFQVHEILPGGRCGCGDPKCKAIGKHPVPAGWQRTIASVAAAETAWRGRNARRGIGLRCGPDAGPGGVLGLDFDRRHGSAETVREWKRRGMKLPKTPTDRTSDGWHVMLRWPEGLDVDIRAQDVGAGVQCRGAKHFLVLAPSWHKSGRRYEPFYPLGEVELAPAPDWLLELVVANSRRKRPIVDGAGDDGYLVPAGQRHKHLIRFAGLLRSCGLHEQTIVECGLSFLRHEVEQEPEMNLGQAERDLRDAARRYPPIYTRREER